MKTIEEYIQESWAEGMLWEFMGWDKKHGPTDEQWLAFKILFPHLN
jgi:hypothetical protein